VPSRNEAQCNRNEHDATFACHSERSEESAFSFGIEREQRGKRLRFRVIYSNKHGGSAGEEGVFCGGAGGPTGFFGVWTTDVDLGGGAAVLGGSADLPATRYFRIFSSRLAPMPRIANKSSTLLNAPYDLRICKILSAVAGPIPGTNCNSSDVAVFKLIGAGGGFFLAAKREGTKHDTQSTKQIRAKDCKTIVA
jgi:hypothetical protein